ncbi:MAG: cob(I)yrinic acid a,c-diamide adenosyltransferase [Candidatus Omnitrophica bacterium]|nr:cob(I)yrinic acid a,c-diamide adenosyltransferase [Candidatus Omnitrophota bacterium]
MIIKKSDKGITSLCFGGQISKGSLRMDAVGDLDELMGALGVARALIKEKFLKDELLEIQKMLIVVSAELATLKKNLSQIKGRISEKDLELLDKKISFLNKKVSLPKCFIIPGESLASAQLNLARAIARRSERKIVRLFEEKQLLNRCLLAWMNRLSQYLFLLSQCNQH